MENKQTQLKRTLDSCNRRRQILAVTSGKGGVGKTNISANLALCLAVSQKKVLLLDCDLSLGNLDVIMDINSRFNISHMISGQKKLDEITYIGPEGLDIVFAGSGLSQLADINDFQRQRIVHDLSQAGKDKDFIVIDTAAGVSKSVVGFCLAADQVLVVTTPEAAAMTDAYAMIKVLLGHDFAGRISVIVNMAQTMQEGKQAYRQISQVVKRFLNADIYDAGVILKNEQLLSAVRLRKPVVLAYPKSQITVSLAALAAKLGRGYAKQTDDDGFFRKVVGWFF